MKGEKSGFSFLIREINDGIPISENKKLKIIKILHAQFNKAVTEVYLLV